jgi:hypothetical protein
VQVAAAEGPAIAVAGRCPQEDEAMLSPEQCVTEGSAFRSANPFSSADCSVTTTELTVLQELRPGPTLVAICLPSR